MKPNKPICDSTKELMEVVDIVWQNVITEMPDAKLITLTVNAAGVELVSKGVERVIKVTVVK